MKKIFNRLGIALFLYAASANVPAKANNYYFSSSQGDDSRTATQAQSPGTPWKTLNKLNSFFSTLKPGDSVLFKSGDTFYGTITINASGTSSSPIVLGAYGAGVKPVITGFTAISSWTNLGGGIYESSSAMSALSTCNMVTIDDGRNQIPYAMGRYPNANATNRGYLTYQSHSGQTSITSNQISGAPNFVGGEVVIRSLRSVIDRCKITAQTSTTVTYTAVSHYIPTNNYGFFFQNHPGTLDQFGEWYYNQSTKKLRMYFGANAPSSYTVKLSTVDVLVSLTNKSYITFDNLAFEGANIDGLYLSGQSALNIKINSCDISFTGQTAVEGINGAKQLNITNCNINWSNNGAIILPGGSAVSAHLVQNCVIKNTAVFAGMAPGDYKTCMAIIAIGSKNIIQGNVIDSTGYVPVYFMFGDSILIKNNVISHYCFVKNDGGATYTFNNTTDPVIYHGQRITGNIILNAGTANEGTTFAVGKTGGGSQGFYSDNNTSNVEIDHNTVFDVNTGAFGHNAHDVNIHDNTFFDTWEAQISLSEDNSNFQPTILPPITGFKIKNNILFSKNISQVPARYRSINNDIANFGTFDSNYFCRPINYDNAIYAEYVKNGLTFSQNYDLAGWKLAYNKDQRSKTTPATISEYTVNGLLSSNKYSNGTYNSNTNGTACSNKGGTCVSSWDNSGKLDGGAYKLSYKGTSTVSTTTSVIIPVSAVNSSKNYILRYSVLGTKNNSSIAIYLKSSTTNTLLTPVRYYPFNTKRSDNEVLFSSPITESSAQLIFKFNDKDSTAYLDNIQLYEADVAINNPDDYIRFEYNSTNETKTITLDASYIDVCNTVYSGNITLAPYTSIILIKQSASSLSSGSQVINSNIAYNKEHGTTQLQLLAFPNPSPTEFNLVIQSKSDEDVEINLFDMNGKSLFYTKGSVQQKYVFGRNLLSGMYILKVTQGKNVQTLKLVK